MVVAIPPVERVFPTLAPPVVIVPAAAPAAPAAAVSPAVETPLVAGPPPWAPPPCAALPPVARLVLAPEPPELVPASGAIPSESLPVHAFKTRIREIPTQARRPATAVSRNGAILVQRVMIAPIAAHRLPYCGRRIGTRKAVPPSAKEMLVSHSQYEIASGITMKNAEDVRVEIVRVQSA